MNKFENVNMGRPKGTGNNKMRLSWKSLCCDIKDFDDFELSEDKKEIIYRMNNDEYIAVSQGDNCYHVRYFYKGLNINCTPIKNDVVLDLFLNRLIADNWDFELEGNIHQFAIRNSCKNNKSQYNMLEEEDD